MSPTSTLHAPLRMARQAGLLYLLIALFGAFAIAYVPSQIIVADDAQATFARLQAQTGLFRAGVLADMMVILLELELTAILYFLLRPVDPVRSMIAAMARYGMVVVMLVNLLLNITAFMIAEGALAASPETVLALFEVHAMGVYLWGVLFGSHLLVLGILIWRSGYLPRVLGGALAIGAFGYLIEGLSQIVGLEYAISSWLIIGLLTLVTLAELGFALWLLIKGLDERKWHAAMA
jgi:Domain of unknown function (DUF4386)